MGIIIKRSELDECTWLVKFQNSKELYYCHDKTIVFENKFAPICTWLNKHEREMMENNRFKVMVQDHEELLKPILFPIVGLVPAAHSISVKNIVKKLSPKYNWLNEKSLLEYILAFRKNLSINKMKDSKQHGTFSVKCPPKPEGTKSDNSSSQYSSELEEMFDLKKPSANTSSQPKSNMFSNVPSKESYDATVARVAAHRAERRKRAPERENYIKKKYPSDTDSNNDLDDRSNSKRHCSASSPPSDKVKDYLSSARRKLDFSSDDFTSSITTQQEHDMLVGK